MNVFLRGTVAVLVFWLAAVGYAAGVGRFGPLDVIAFDSNRTNNYEIYLMDLPTGILKNMTNHPAQDRNPAWSADGRYLAFESIQRDTGSSIYVIDTQRLDREPSRVTPAFVRAVQPTWSPGGNYIAFSGAMDNMFNNEIFLVNLYDRQVIRVTNSPMQFDYGPQWSPDGGYIAYGTYDATTVSPSDVYVVRFQEMTLQLAQERPRFVPVRISEHDAAADPAWTPDGDVVFRYEGATSQLYRTRPTGDAAADLLDIRPSVMEKPDVAPDGERVAFGYAPNTSATWRELVVASMDGSSWRRITTGADRSSSWDGAPAWKPR